MLCKRITIRLKRNVILWSRNGFEKLENIANTISFKKKEKHLKAFVYLASETEITTLQNIKNSYLPLSDATLAVKDLFDVKGMPTTYGSPIYVDNIATETAEVVTLAQLAGAKVIGKTVTTEFATYKPGPTTNPQNTDYTPGGSSSGSAAAVGGGLVSHALGTQTAGSVIRPAAFCGVIGFLPSMGLVSRKGLKVVSPTLDRVGVFTSSVKDAETITSVITGLPRNNWKNTRPCHIGFFSDSTWLDADAATKKTLFAFKGEVERSEDLVVDLGEGQKLFDLMKAQSDIMQYEVVRSLKKELTNHPDLISDELKAYCSGGLAISVSQYTAALEIGNSGRKWAAALFERVDVIASPSARTLPLKTLASTGDPFINRAWSLLYLPCITLPTGQIQSGLKSAVQLIGAFEKDTELLSIASRFETKISAIGL